MRFALSMLRTRGPAAFSFHPDPPASTPRRPPAQHRPPTDAHESTPAVSTGCPVLSSLCNRFLSCTDAFDAAQILGQLNFCFTPEDATPGSTGCLVWYLLNYTGGFKILPLLWACIYIWAMTGIVMTQNIVKDSCWLVKTSYNCHKFSGTISVDIKSSQSR